MERPVDCQRCKKCGLVRVKATGHPTSFWSSFLLNNPTANTSPFLAAIAWARVCRHAATDGTKHPSCLVETGEVDEVAANIEIARINEDIYGKAESDGRLEP